jgi:hypothetical protein
MAQFEDLALRYNSKFLLKCSVSYCKILLLPSAIESKGYTSGLSLDSKVGHVNSKVSRVGGSGGNVEEWTAKWEIRYSSTRVAHVQQCWHCTHVQ